MEKEATLDRDAVRQKFIDDLGLIYERRSRLVDHPLIDRIEFYRLPCADGRRYERTVHMLVFGDGSFSTSIDDGHLNIAKSQAAIKAMSLAAESVSE